MMLKKYVNQLFILEFFGIEVFFSISLYILFSNLSILQFL